MSNKSISKRKIDMLNGPLALPLLFFAIPLAASSILQQLFNAADIAIVGKFVGGSALAAVGANAPIIGLFVNAFVGLAVGTNVVIAQRIGRHQENKVPEVVHTSILFAIYGGVALAVIGMFIAPLLLEAIGTPENVLGQATLYLRIYFIGVPFSVVFNFGSAILRSVGDTKRPMICLMVSGVLNVCLNLVFVVVLHLGVAGVAIATSLASMLNATLVTFILTKETSFIKLEKEKLKISRPCLVAILKMGGPAAIQSMVFSLSNVCLQAAVNSFGTNAIAGSAAAVNFEFFNYFIINAFNQAAVTFIGQNYAAGKHDRCKKIFLICAGEACLGLLCLNIITFSGQSFFLGLFATDPKVLDFAKIRMNMVPIIQYIAVTYEVTGSAIRGTGRSMTPAVITIIGSVGFRLVWLVTVFKAFRTFEIVMLVYPVSWVFTGAMMLTMYFLMWKKHERNEKVLQ